MQVQCSVRDSNGVVLRLETDTLEPLPASAIFADKLRTGFIAKHTQVN